jgi:hypothetical protein
MMRMCGYHDPSYSRHSAIVPHEVVLSNEYCVPGRKKKGKKPDPKVVDAGEGEEAVRNFQPEIRKGWEL